MILSHRIALDPTFRQQSYFMQAAGCARFVWNLALERWNTDYEAGKKPNGMKLKKEFNRTKYEQYPWMRNVHRDCHSQPFTHLQQAFVGFFKGISKHPKFHAKGRRDSFYVANDKLQADGNRVRLPLVGWVRMREELRFEGKIMSAAVSRTAQRWFISIRVEVENPSRQRTANGVAGVDVGIKSAAVITREDGVDSSVEEIKAPKPLKRVLRSLRRKQRSVSRRMKGGKNRRKLVQEVARVHARVAAIRSDFWHKLTTRLCRENQAVAIESLNVKGMTRNRRLARALQDVAFGEFRLQMEYKVKLFGTRLVLADRWYPSSKTCSQCGAVKESLSLRERVFRCPVCGYVQDRDVNASRNLCALAKLPTACGEVTPAERKGSKAASSKQELDRVHLGAR